MNEETYRNLVVFFLAVLIGLYIYDLMHFRNEKKVNSVNTVYNDNTEKMISLPKQIKSQKVCNKNICFIDKKNKKKHKEEEEIKSIGEINNGSLDDIESVVKKISNI